MLENLKADLPMLWEIGLRPCGRPRFVYSAGRVIDFLPGVGMTGIKSYVDGHGKKAIRIDLTPLKTLTIRCDKTFKPQNNGPLYGWLNLTIGHYTARSIKECTKKSLSRVSPDGLADSVIWLSHQLCQGDMMFVGFEFRDQLMLSKYDIKAKTLVGTITEPSMHGIEIRKNHADMMDEVSVIQACMTVA